jgi:hypothetical protein
MNMTALRIYADYNGLGRSERGPFVIPLDTFGSLRDLSNAGVRLREGLALVVADWSDEDEDLEADATAVFDPKAGVWLAVLGPDGYRYVPKGARTNDDRFLCLGCRRDLGSDPATGARPAAGVAFVDGPGGQACPVCGTSIAAALAPPEPTGNLPEPAT